jgi:hypothetical protein
MIATKTEYAKLRGVTQAQVSHWTKAGRIAIVDGKVDVETSNQMLAETLHPSRGGKRVRTRQDRPQASQVSPTSANAPPVATEAYARVRTAREAFRAKSEELEYRERVGELVERDRFDKALVDALGPILSSFDSLSARIGPALAAESDVRKVQNMIDDAVAAIRQDTADTLRRMIAGAPAH